MLFKNLQIVKGLMSTIVSVDYRKLNILCIVEIVDGRKGKVSKGHQVVRDWTLLENCCSLRFSSSWWHYRDDIMDSLITNASVEELTETYSDVCDLGVPYTCSNNSYDSYDTNSFKNYYHWIVAMMYNYWFNVSLLLFNKKKYVIICIAVFIVYLNSDIEVNEKYVFLALYSIDVRIQLMNAEIAEAIGIAIVYFAYNGGDRAVDPVAYSIL